MKKYLVALISTVLMLSFSLTLTTQAASTSYSPIPCPYPDAPRYNPNLAVAVQDEQLQLIDLSTGAVLRVLEDQVLDVYYLYWGLNCRYFFANSIVQPLGKWWGQSAYIYDVTTGARIFNTRYDPFLVQRWGPSRQQFIIKSINGTFFMSEALNEPVLLFKHDPYGRSMRRIEWDTAHNQVLIIFAGNAGYLNIYDMSTGATLAAISNPAGCTPPIDYIASEDGHYLIIFTDIRRSGHPACVTVYNRDTGTQQSVNAEEYTSSRPAQIALSPDGRYLVIGILGLRVWDLSNLPANFVDREPLYRHEGPLTVIETVRFINDTTVETTSNDGTQDWDVISGKLQSS